MEWIGRSKEMPISIRLYYPREEGLPNELDISNPDQIGAVVEIFRALSNISHRWKDLDMTVPGRLVKLFPDTPLRPSHSFRTLQILMDILDDQEPFRMKMFNPTHISLDSFHTKFIDIDWSNLTWAHISSTDVDACYMLLERAPRLFYCTFSYFAPTPFTIPERPLVHPFIREFRIECFGSPIVDMLLDNLAFPNLKRMTLAVRRVPHDALLSFFKRSSCELQEFHVEGDVAISLLRNRSLATLVKLDISTSEVDQNPHDVVHFLAQYQDEQRNDEQDNENGRVEVDPALRLPLLLPKLERFIYTTSSKIAFPWTSVPLIFGRISELQNPARRPLKSLYIYFDQSQDAIYVDMDVVLPSLLALNEAGMDIRIISDISGRDALKPDL